MTACVDSGDPLHHISSANRHFGEKPLMSSGLPGLGPKSNTALCPTDLIRQLAEDQGRCSSDVAALHARLLALEQQVLSTADRLDIAAASSRMPMVISEGPSMSRLIANSGPEIESTAMAVADAGLVEAGARLTDQEAAVVRKRLEDLEEVHSDDVGGLRDAIEATREGMARLARDLQIERNELVETQRDVQSLALIGPSIDRFQKTLKAELMDMIRDSVSSAQAAVNSRVQLTLIELREEVQRTPRELVDAGQLNARSGAARSLNEWLPQETDGNIAATKSMLTYLGVFDGMMDGFGSPDTLVARPNFRFVHRAIIAIKQATGYPSGILEDWPDPYDAKLDFLKQVWSSVASALDLTDLDFDAVGVLKCTNRDGTRRLLQLLAIAASKERGLQRRPNLPQLPAPSGG